MIIIKKFNDIYDVVKREREFIVDISKLSIKQRLRIIDFLCGLTFINGTLEKINANTYKCIY